MAVFDTILPVMKNGRFGKRIREQLLIEIRQRPVNDRLPPEIELAARYGVNRLTVNKVLSQLSREGYVERIRGKGTFIIGKDHRVQTATPAARAVGQIVMAYPDYFSFDLWSKVNCAEAIAHENEVELINFKMNKGTTFESIASLLRQNGEQIKGLITASAVDAKGLAVLSSLGIRVVVLGAIDRPTAGENVVCVHRDYYREGYLGVDYFARAGHRKLAYVANEPWNAGSRLQFQGVKAALYDHGLNLRDLVRSPNGIPLWEDSTAAGYAFTADILREHKVTAIMYRSTPGAVGGLRAIAEAGLKVPEDVSIIAEGQSPDDGYLVPPLTNIVCDYKAWVAVAFDVILNGARRHEKQITIDVNFIERQSVRRLNEPARAM